MTKCLLWKCKPYQMPYCEMLYSVYIICRLCLIQGLSKPDIAFKSLHIGAMYVPIHKCKESSSCLFVFGGKHIYLERKFGIWRQEDTYNVGHVSVPCFIPSLFHSKIWKHEDCIAIVGHSVLTYCWPKFRRGRLDAGTVYSHSSEMKVFLNMSCFALVWIWFFRVSEHNSHLDNSKSTFRTTQVKHLYN